MKKLYCLIPLFFLYTLYGNAQMQNQDSIFIANVWRLQKLEINHNIIPAPNNTELSFPKLTADILNNEHHFSAEGCAGGGGPFHFVNNMELFIDDYTTLAMMMCTIQANNIFSGTYNFDFIESNMLNNFNFIITNYNTYLELIITGQNGNKAYYHNNLSASVNKVELKEKIKLYPNPVSDTFFISGDDQILSELKEIVLYDLSGKIVFKQKVTENNNYDISQLSSGNYIVYFKSNKQLLHYGLIIKK